MRQGCGRAPLPDGPCSAFDSRLKRETVIDVDSMAILITAAQLSTSDNVSS